MDWFKQASTSAVKSDQVFFAVLALSFVFLVFITAMMLWFVYKYAKKRHPKAEQIDGHVGLEILWTGVPLVMFLAIFYYGWTNYDYMSTAPRDAMVVKVTARQWSWSFEYPNGKQTDTLYAALDRPMKLDVRSVDVIHGFFIPAFRMKIDALPGRTTNTWFHPTKVGAYDIECTVICGAKHALMLSKVVTVPEDEFKAWYFGDENAPAPGKNLPVVSEGHAVPPTVVKMRTAGCLACHSVDGRPMVGPTFKGLFGQPRQVDASGQTRSVVADEAYLRRAITDPMVEVVKGYPPTMPPHKLSEADVTEIVTYLKTLK